MNVFHNRKRVLAVGAALALLAGVAWSVRSSRTGPRVPKGGSPLPPPGQRRAHLEKRVRASREQLDRYFALPQRERIVYLDSLIDRMQAVQKQVAASPRARPGANRAALAALNTRGVGRPLRPEDRERRRREMEERRRGREQMRDASTPEDRAKAAEFIKQLNARMGQRGLRTSGYLPP